MMSDKKRQTHERILAAAGRLVRERGLSGIGVDSVMKAASLTHGGFYAHFASREALIGEMLARAVEQMRVALFAGLDDRSGRDWLRAVVRRYLSRSHRDMVAEGCPVPALISELARSSPAHRQIFEAHLRQTLAEVEQKCPAGLGLTPYDRALATIALSVGGIALARAVADPALSDRILTACQALALPELAAPESDPRADRS